MSYFATRRNILLSAGVMQGTRLDALSVGDSVYIFEGTEGDGNLFQYILIAADYPQTGVVLLMRNGAAVQMQFAASNVTGYAGSLIDSYLGNDTTGYLSQFVPDIRAKLQTVPIASHTSGSAVSLDRRAFILSDTEIRDTGVNNKEGTKIAYFSGHSFPSNAAWTRQPYYFNGATFYQAYTIWGGNTFAQVNGSLAIVPCICLLGSERVDANNTLIV